MSDQVSRPLKIALVQQASLSPDPERNKAELCEILDELASKANFVMPTELSTTPYFGIIRDRSLEAWAEELDGPFLARVRSIAAKHKCAVLVPVYLATSDGAFVNAVVVIDEDGRMVQGSVRGSESLPYYSKVHLPNARRGDDGIDETFYFRRGTRFPVFHMAQARVGVLTCYDRRFPEAWRSLVLAGAELIFVPSCVPAWNPSSLASTGDMFLRELQTRACENGVFVAACNRAGEQRFRDIIVNFIGGSCVIDPAGGVVGQLSSAEAGNLIVEVDRDKVRRVRRRLTLLQDRQPDAYDLQTRQGDWQ